MIKVPGCCSEICVCRMVDMTTRLPSKVQDVEPAWNQFRTSSRVALPVSVIVVLATGDFNNEHFGNLACFNHCSDLFLVSSLYCSMFSAFSNIDGQRRVYSLDTLYFEIFAFLLDCFI